MHRCRATGFCLLVVPLLAAAGSGNIGLSGAAASLDISIPGSGRIVAEDLTVRSADVSINGSGSVTYLGNPTSVRQSINGSGTVAPA